MALTMAETEPADPAFSTTGGMRGGFTEAFRGTTRFASVGGVGDEIVFDEAESFPSSIATVTGAPARSSAPSWLATVEDDGPVSVSTTDSAVAGKMFISGRAVTPSTSNNNAATATAAMTSRWGHAREIQVQPLQGELQSFLE